LTLLSVDGENLQAAASSKAGASPISCPQCRGFTSSPNIEKHGEAVYALAVDLGLECAHNAIVWAATRPPFRGI
jgi:hypothetical protein